LTLAVLLGVIAGCGGNATKPPSNIIAFESSRALDGSDAINSAGNIWVANADGSGATPLTVRTDGSFDDGLVWSPDGSKIAFVSSRPLDGGNGAANTAFDVWVMNADGSGGIPLTRLTTLNLSNYDLVWSPDGRKLAFTSNSALDGSDAINSNFTQNIWVANTDGTGLNPLTRFSASSTAAFSPAWSRDGSRIAFSSGGAFDGSNVPGPSWNLWIMNADGSDRTPLTRFTFGASFQPTFSPDGAKLAFFSDRALNGSDTFIVSGSTNIWVAATDGSGAVPLTRYAAAGASVFSDEIFWSPDGKKIAFTSTGALDGSDAGNTNSTENIWVANTDGSGTTPLTRLTYSPRFPAPGVVAGAFAKGWSPDGISLAFASDRALDGSNAPTSTGISNAWVMNADGSNAAPLSNLPVSNPGSFSPAWKP
jgi:Tol biopolymer transport system component